MGFAKPSSNERPRELRRRVVLPARIRTGTQWSDACILNISSRGLMIHSARAGRAGSKVELRRGPHVIVAQIVWNDGSRAGLQCDDRLPVEEILSASQSSALQLVASGGAIVDRRKQSRCASLDRRAVGRLVEFVGAGIIAAALSILIWEMAREALGRPIARAEAALAPQF